MQLRGWQREEFTNRDVGAFVSSSTFSRRPQRTGALTSFTKRSSRAVAMVVLPEAEHPVNQRVAPFWDRAA